MKRTKALFKTVFGGAAAALALGAATASAQAEELKFAAAFPAGVENAWVRAWLDGFEKVKADKPHGLDLSVDYTESVYGPKGLEVLEAYSESGEYDIIWAHSSYSDEVEELKDQFPEILYVTVGAGNRPLGDNSYLIYMHGHEAAYLAGIFAGETSESGKFGVVGLFPADDVNDQVNGFIDGVTSVNPDASVKVTFIESWYDPGKAAEAASAQISAGADIIYQLGESYQVCKERGILCIGNYIDMSKIAPEVVPVSTLVNWEPQINYVIDQWKQHQETGEPYDAPMEQVWFSMTEGGGDISAFNEALADRIPDAARKAVAEARDRILSGELVVEMDVSMPVSN